MHMEVLADPNAWTNQVVGQFYQKDKVVGVKRKQIISISRFFLES